MFDPDEYTAALSQTGIYRCAGNAAWLAAGWRPDCGVPIVRSRILALRKYYFSEASRQFPVVVTIAMMQTDDPMTQKGALRSITPCEFLHAFFMQIADDIESGQPEDTLRLWRTAILTMPMCFELFEGEADLWSRARELRDSIAASHETVSYTAVQRIWSVNEFRKRKEKASGKLSASSIAVLYNADSIKGDVPGQETVKDR